MKIIGIYDGHNSNAALIEDGKILKAVEEERFSRIKNHDGRVLKGPIDSIRYCLEGQDKIDLIAIALEHPEDLYKNAYSSWLKDIDHKKRESRKSFLLEQKNILAQKFDLDNGYEVAALPGVTQQNRIDKIKKILEELGLSKVPIQFINHHLCHNSSAYFTSGKTKGLCLSLDGKGDDLCGMICLANDGEVKEIARVNYLESIGHFYSGITVALGFKAVRHEGKITGLAAYGTPPAELLEKFRQLFKINNDGEIFSELPTNLNIGPYPHTVFGDYLTKIKDLIDGYTREEVAAAAQVLLEEVVTEWASFWVKKTGEKDLFLSGGVFANVKLNQRILEIEGVNSVYVHPAMSDSGLGVGAALEAYHNARLANGTEYTPYALGNIYFGPSFSDDQILCAIKDSGLKFDQPFEIEKEIAHKLDEGKIVALYNGGLEYGPRSLGARTVLYHTKDVKVNDWLNSQLGRTEFMPFAPVTMYEKAKDCYVINEGKDPYYTSKFMTITMDCKDNMKEMSPAVVHIDGTARPQLIKREDNPLYYDILNEYFKISGIPSLVNTSFNMHEEPIVCTPAEAIKAFEQSNLDFICLGSYLVEKRS